MQHEKHNLAHTWGTSCSDEKGSDSRGVSHLVTDVWMFLLSPPFEGCLDILLTCQLINTQKLIVV